MLNKLKNWLNDRFPNNDAASADRLKTTGTHSAARPNKAAAKKENDLALNEKTRKRNRLIREDTGTHETLTIIDESLEEPDEDASFDPYNTGGFDRSNNWKSRS